MPAHRSAVVLVAFAALALALALALGVVGAPGADSASEHYTPFDPNAHLIASTGGRLTGEGTDTFADTDLFKVLFGDPAVPFMLYDVHGDGPLAARVNPSHVAAQTFADLVRRELKFGDEPTRRRLYESRGVLFSAYATFTELWPHVFEGTPPNGLRVVFKPHVDQVHMIGLLQRVALLAEASTTLWPDRAPPAKRGVYLAPTPFAVLDAPELSATHEAGHALAEWGPYRQADEARRPRYSDQGHVEFRGKEYLEIPGGATLKVAEHGGFTAVARVRWVAQSRWARAYAFGHPQRYALMLALTDQSMAASVNGRRSNATFQLGEWTTVASVHRYTADGLANEKWYKDGVLVANTDRVPRVAGGAYPVARIGKSSYSADELAYMDLSKLSFFQGALSEVDLQAVVGNRVAAVVTAKPQGWTDSAIKMAASPNMCVDVAGFSKENGGKVHMWECHGGANQSWTYTPETQQLRDKNSGKCLDLPGGNQANGTGLHIWPCDPKNDNQRWEVVDDGVFKKPGTEKCVDVSGGSTNNGANVQLWDCHGGAAQRFQLP